MKLLATAATALTLLVSSLHAQVEHVDPTIGGVGLVLVPTRPLVHMPNSMVRVYPVRKDQLDFKISSSPLSIVSHRQQQLAGQQIHPVRQTQRQEPRSPVVQPRGSNQRRPPGVGNGQHPESQTRNRQPSAIEPDA